MTPISQWFNTVKSMAGSWSNIWQMTFSVWFGSSYFFYLMFPTSFGVSLNSSVGSSAFNSLTNELRGYGRCQKTFRDQICPDSWIIHMFSRHVQYLHLSTYNRNPSSLALTNLVHFSTPKKKKKKNIQEGCVVLIQVYHMPLRTQNPSVFPLYHP